MRKWDQFTDPFVYILATHKRFHSNRRNKITQAEH